MEKILVIHGPNLNKLGEREPEVYGKTSLEEINKMLKGETEEKEVDLDVVQSNHEGEIVSIIGEAKEEYSGIIINPAGYTHTSVAIRDAIKSADIPTIEVHLSNIYSREDFRKTSLIAPVVKGQISGFGGYSYYLALLALINTIKE